MDGRSVLGGERLGLLGRFIAYGLVGWCIECCFTSAMDLAPYEPIDSAVVSGLKDEPALDILAGWLATRIDGPVTRAVGDLKVELIRSSETITLARPQEGVTATLSRTGRPDALLPLARRETRDCLAEDLRRLDADDIYYDALRGMDKVQYT